MAHDDKQLAVRTGSPTGRTPTTIVYKPAPEETQYLVFHTLLGDAALYWSANWLAGYFCVSDFPLEWVGYVQSFALGPQYESAYDGQEHTFATTTESKVRDHVTLHRRVLPPAMMDC